ncbi:MAG TPA: hypothetical protein VFJ82_21045 [Longimicrobium sp.]|nr:hypothetical protein [Longimicrobium sp.]
MDEDAVAEFLGRCPGHVLSQLLHRALAARPENGYAGSGDSVELRMVLVQASRVRNGPASEWEPWELAVVADAGGDAGGMIDRPGEPCLEEGTCPRCEVVVVSHAKEARCPLCRRSVSLA